MGKKERDFFDSPRNRKILAACFFAVLAVLIVIDFFIPKHGYFHWDELPVFYAFFGFFGCVLLVVIAKYLRLFLKRRENYYD